MQSSASVNEMPATYGSPVSPEVLEMAQQAVRDFHECFWWWHPDSLKNLKESVSTRDQARMVVECLREHGGHRAWKTAQQIWKCLLPSSNVM